MRGKAGRKDLEACPGLCGSPGCRIGLGLDWDCHLHVPDVVDVQGLLQADHQALGGLKIASRCGELRKSAWFQCFVIRVMITMIMIIIMLVTHRSVHPHCSNAVSVRIPTYFSSLAIDVKRCLMENSSKTFLKCSILRVLGLAPETTATRLELKSLSAM